jgi:hypothetical protein
MSAAMARVGFFATAGRAWDFTAPGWPWVSVAMPFSCPATAASADATMLDTSFLHRAAISYRNARASLCLVGTPSADPP